MVWEEGAGSGRLLEGLSAVVGAGHVLTSLPDKLAYSRDCWPQGIILARGGRWMVHRPVAIVQPGSEREVVEVVRLIVEAGAPLVPYGAGSGVCGGALPDQGGVVVDVKRLSAIEALDVEGLKARVGAGAIGMIVETELERRGLTLGHFPSSLYCSTIGGYLAARSAGQCSSRYGKIEDMAQSLRWVTGRGELLDSAPGLGASAWGGGWDPTQLVIGSEGTLGVITSGLLRLHRAPEARFYRGFRCERVEDGLEAIAALMQAGLRPAVTRLYDEFDTLIAGSLSPRAMGRAAAVDDEEALPEGLLSSLRQAAARLSLPERLRRRGGVLPELGERLRRASRGLLGRAIGQPLVLNQLADALPGGCLLVVGFEGDARGAAREAEAGFALLRRRCEDFGPEPGEHWLKNRFNVSYKQSPMFEAGAFVDTMEVSTSWGNLVRLYHAVKKAVAPHAFIMAHFSHAYEEGASIYFTFAGFGADTDEALEVYARVWSCAQEAVLASGASVSHHHGVGLSKARYVPRDQRGGRVLFAALGRAWDPTGRLNPGKVWPAARVEGEIDAEVLAPGSPPSLSPWSPGSSARVRCALEGVEAARPGSEAALCEVIGGARGPLWVLGSGRHALSLPRGGGEGVVLDLRGLDRVLGWDAASRVVHVEAGISVGALTEALLARGASLSGWRREHPEATIGGLLGRVAPVGPALWGGDVKERCVGLEAVTARGQGYTPLEAPRKAAGPDLRHLFLGGGGRFGVITRAALGVSGPVEARRAWELPFEGPRGGALRWLQGLFARGFRAPNLLWSGATNKVSALLEGGAAQVELMSALLAEEGAGLGLVEVDPAGWYDPAGGDLREGADPLAGRAECAEGAVGLWGGLCELAALPEAALGEAVLYDASAHQGSLWWWASSGALEGALAPLRSARVGWWCGRGGLAASSPEAAVAVGEAMAAARGALDPEGLWGGWG
jgi:alkyldihydroxyacetonephosphate synthase